MQGRRSDAAARRRLRKQFKGAAADMPELTLFSSIRGLTDAAENQIWKRFCSKLWYFVTSCTNYRGGRSSSPDRSKPLSTPRAVKTKAMPGSRRSASPVAWRYMASALRT